MYYPKSQTQTSLYSNGELTIRSTGQSYTGFYWSTSTGKFFMGKTPESPKSNIELLKANKEANFGRDQEPDVEKSNKVTLSYSSNVVNYLQLRPDIDIDNLPQIPIYSPVIPTKEDYNNQEFIRFFCKKRNSSYFIEINQSTFTKLSEEDSSFDYETYIPLKLPWVLIGEQSKVVLENKNAVKYTEYRLGALGLSQYLKFNYLLYYNTTPGVIKKDSKRIYSDTGIEIPSKLPSNYRLIKNKKACAGCVYLQQGVCNKWSAPVREEYYCDSFKEDKMSSQQLLESFSSKTNIYNK